MKIIVGNTGPIVRGSVLDCNKDHLERKLKDYDRQLYLIWNPTKKKKMGVWELRRRDAMKSIVDWAEFEGNCYTRLEYAENNFANHILDIPVLGYHVLEKLKEMDTWSKGYGIDSIVAQAERNFDHHQEEQSRKHKEELQYNLRQYNKGWKRFQEMVQSGTNVADIALHWNKKK